VMQGQQVDADVPLPNEVVTKDNVDSTKPVM